MLSLRFHTVSSARSTSAQAGDGTRSLPLPVLMLVARWFFLVIFALLLEEAGQNTNFVAQDELLRLLPNCQRRDLSFYPGGKNPLPAPESKRQSHRHRRREKRSCA